MKLIKLTKQQSQIVEDNHNLIYGYAHFRNLDLEDWYGKLALELCHSVIHWDSERGSLSTYYYMRADTMVMLDYQKRNYQKRRANENTLEFDSSDDGCNIYNETLDDILETRTETSILNEILECGDERVIKMRYEGYSQEEIADEIGVTQPTISRMLDRILEKYKRGSELNY